MLPHLRRGRPRVSLSLEGETLASNEPSFRTPPLCLEPISPSSILDPGIHTQTETCTTRTLVFSRPLSGTRQPARLVGSSPPRPCPHPGPAALARPMAVRLRGSRSLPPRVGAGPPAKQARRSGVQRVARRWRLGVVRLCMRVCVCVRLCVRV